MTARERRAVIAGGAVVVGAVLLLRVVPWIVRRTVAAHLDLQERATLLARGQDELAQAATLRDSAAVLTQRLAGLATKLVNGHTPAEALADLTARLNLTATRSSAKLEQVDPVPDSLRAGRLRRVRLRATITADVRGLAALVRVLEFGDAVLTVDRLAVVSPDPGAPERQAEVLRVEITVSGWYLETNNIGERRSG